MAIDYRAISKDNERRYGTEIATYGPVVLANLYAERTHFVFELMQNTEDALRRCASPKSRAVRFEIGETSLVVRHYGEPFTENDVRSICGLAESTKEKTDIGRFGIGFKSVYAWTDRPEIHSGGEHFAIENYVHPTPTAEIDSAPDETVIVIPFKDDVADSRSEIVEALQADSGSALLFLREIEEIEWQVDGESSGHYLRERKSPDSGVQVVTIVGADSTTETESSWLVFSKPVEHEGAHVGHVEIAFRHVSESDDNPAHIKRVSFSPLSAYFPTEVQTRLGFLIQGPYRTTPSRENVPRADEWNKALIAQTASLLQSALPWLRDRGYLTAAGLECLPIERENFSRVTTRYSSSLRFESHNEPTMFFPLFEAAKEALGAESLLPGFPNGHVRAAQGLLGGTEALRELFSTEQLRVLFQAEVDVVWLDPEITPNRTHDLHAYLRSELNVIEAGTETIVRRLNKAFLEAQPDTWIRALYEFLDDQRGIHNQDWFTGLPLLRLEDRRHVALRVGGRPGAYLPTPSRTDYPTLLEAVCGSDKALSFLQSAKLRKPDLVDDVLENVLSIYSAGSEVDEQRYGDHLTRIIEASQNASGGRRGVLLAALRGSPFVRVVNAMDDERGSAKPGETYAPVERLRELFRDLNDVLFVDGSYSSLQGEDARELLKECGMAEHMRVGAVLRANPDDEQYARAREEAGAPYYTQYSRLQDQRLDRLTDVLGKLASASPKRQAQVARSLWDELRDLTTLLGDQLFQGQYEWFHYEPKRQTVKSSVATLLNNTAWIPVGDGTLVTPSEFTLESLEWPRDEVLERHISFKAPADDQTVALLAEKADISVETLELARKLERLGVPSEEIERLVAEYESSAGPGQSVAEPGEEADARRRDGSSTREEFRSYVGVQRRSEQRTGDAGHTERMNLEELALRHIETREPAWARTEQGNPGFDLYQTDADGEIVRWCEVKSLSGAWGDRPVTMSHTQFEWAQEKGDAFWLYVVEHADDPDQIRILRIQDPAGQAETFTFDEGWAAVADAGDEAE